MQEKKNKQEILSIEEYLEMRREKNKLLTKIGQNVMIQKQIEIQNTKEIQV
jgi:hypothetical protein